MANKYAEPGVGRGFDVRVLDGSGAVSDFGRLKRYCKYKVQIEEIC